MPDDEMMHIVKCKHCGRYEYYGVMRWLSGSCMCRNCYETAYEDAFHTVYGWTDLQGHRPTEAEFLTQEDAYCDACSSKDCNGCEHQHERNRTKEVQY